MRLLSRRKEEQWLGLVKDSIDAYVRHLAKGWALLTISFWQRTEANRIRNK
jgi:hypothetical protein